MLLRFLPKGKTVVLGLVNTKLGEMESKDDIKPSLPMPPSRLGAGLSA